MLPSLLTRALLGQSTYATANGTLPYFCRESNLPNSGDEYALALQHGLENQRRVVSSNGSAFSLGIEAQMPLPKLQEVIISAVILQTFI